LLTLEPLFNGQDRQELLRQIAFDEPRSARQIDPAIPVDLETILSKALAKNREERYETAQELTGDLQRFLRDEPIQARRPGVIQRTLKWSRRHRVLVTSVLGALLLAVPALLACLMLVWHAHNRVLAERQVAEKRSEIAQRAVDEMYLEAEKWMPDGFQLDPVQAEFLHK